MFASRYRFHVDVGLINFAQPLYHEVKRWPQAVFSVIADITN